METAARLFMRSVLFFVYGADDEVKDRKISASTRKLFGFVGLTFFLVLAALGTGGFYFFKIEQANLLKEDVAKTVETVLVTRAAEKTYLQFFKAEQKQEFETKAGDVKGLV